MTEKSKNNESNNIRQTHANDIRQTDAKEQGYPIDGTIIPKHRNKFGGQQGINRDEQFIIHVDPDEQDGFDLDLREINKNEKAKKIYNDAIQNGNADLFEVHKQIKQVLDTSTPTQTTQEQTFKKPKLKKADKMEQTPEAKSGQELNALGNLHQQLAEQEQLNSENQKVKAQKSTQPNVKPKLKTVFKTTAGDITTWYYDAVMTSSYLILVSDIREEFTTQFTPPASTEQTLTLELEQEGQQAVSLEVFYINMKFTYENYEFTVFMLNSKQ